jgi:anti-sigma regulatory factor (Ser/Thr protein kinase)
MHSSRSTTAQKRLLPLFKLDLRQLAHVRAFIAERASSLGIHAEIVDSLCLAVDEAVTNIIVHGYRGEGDVSIDMEADGRNLVIRLGDKAPPFDLTERLGAEAPVLGERTKPGGLGIYLIGQSMDDIYYDRVDDENRLTLIKRDVLPD